MFLESRDGEHAMWVLQKYVEQAKIWEKMRFLSFGKALVLCPGRLLHLLVLLAIGVICRIVQYEILKYWSQ